LADSEVEERNAAHRETRQAEEPTSFEPEPQRGNAEE